MKIKKSLKNQNFDTISHARTQKRGVPEEAKIGRTITRFVFSTCALGAPMSDYPRDTVSEAEPLCTDVKDHPGLGPHNSLKLMLLLVILLILLVLVVVLYTSPFFTTHLFKSLLCRA